MKATAPRDDLSTAASKSLARPVIQEYDRNEEQEEAKQLVYDNEDRLTDFMQIKLETCLCRVMLDFRGSIEDSSDPS